MIDDTDAMGSILKGLVLEGTPEERLQTVLTKAKERGLCADRIFSFFTQAGELEITRESFLEALEKLGNTIIVLSDDELTDLVKKFDTGESSLQLSAVHVVLSSCNTHHHLIPSFFIPSLTPP